MTECPICKGRGTIGYFHIDHFADIECDRCNGRGEVSEVEMTNEEWLRSASTEQLAEAITDFIKRMANAEEVELNINKLAWVRWLKQPHTNE